MNRIHTRAAISLTFLPRSLVTTTFGVKLEVDGGESESVAESKAEAEEAAIL